MSFATYLRTFFDTLFRSRYLLHLEAELLLARHERDRLQAKLDRYEVILLPSTPAGAAYTRSLSPPKPQLSPSSVAAPRTRSWTEVQADWVASQAAAEEKEEVAS